MSGTALPYEPVALPLGARPVPTEPFEAVRLFGSQVLALAGILLVTGPPGTGKTYAADSFAASAGVPVVKLHRADIAKGHEVLRDLLSGLGEPAEGHGRVLLEAARGALVGRRLLVYIDEAHLLNREALRQVRWLFDQRDMRFALVMTGVDFTSAFASAPELESRIARRVVFGKLGGAALVPALRRHHPILAATDRALLIELNDRYCLGLWRHWEHLLVAAAGYGATADAGITREVAASALAAITGGV